MSEQKNEVLRKRVMKRLSELFDFTQKGGGVVGDMGHLLDKITCGISNSLPLARTTNFSSSASIGNLAKQIMGAVENNIAAVSDGICAVGSVISLPSDLGHDLGKPNEPLPSNTPIHRAIDMV